MTAYTSTQSGDFSDNAVWGGGGHPSANGDTFTVASGHVVDFNMDTSGLANGFGASTINGTLRAKRAAGAYYLKMNGILTVSTTGTLDASDGSGGAYRSDATFTILLNGNFSITVSGSGVVNLICGEPTHKYVKLTQVEAIAATTLHVDTDVSGEALWAGALVRVDDINQAAESEERTVSGTPSATVITITAGLTAAKASGAYVILVTRNVKVLGASTASGTGILAATNPVVSAEIRNIATGFSAAGGIGGTVGGSITGCTTAIQSGSGVSFSGVISGCTNGFSAGAGFTVTGLISGCTSGVVSSSGPILAGIITGCTNAVSSVYCPLITGSISGCASGIVGGSGADLRGAALSNNTRDLNLVNSLRASNSLFGSSTEFLSYNSAGRSLIDYAESIDHDQTAGAFRAWTRGGITSSVASPVFDASRARSYNAVCESAAAYAFLQRTVLVPANGSVYVRCYVRKDASMAYLPRLHVFSAEKEPLVSGSADAEVTMTNSTDTWEVLEATVTNTTDAAKLYVVRMLAKNASGNVYFDPEINVSSGVSRSRLVNAA